MAGYKMTFNQDYTSIAVLSPNGFRLFSIASADKVEEIYSNDSEQMRMVERLFNSSLVVLVTVDKPKCLKMLHFRKQQEICNCTYPTDILSVRMNRQHLVVCLADSLHIHDIRDMKLLRTIPNIKTNNMGLCTLSLNSHLAFPISSSVGELRIFNAVKLRQEITVRAHNNPLSALNFSPNGLLLATASERGTVIRVFCVKDGQRLQEFRRGVKRCVRIASLVFSFNVEYLCASSNTETVHIFKLNTSLVEAATQKVLMEAANSQEDPTNRNRTQVKSTNPAGVVAHQKAESTAASDSAESTATATTTPGHSSWSGYLSKAVSSYLIPSTVSDTLAQDRAFATAVLAKPGLKHAIGLAPVEKHLQLLIACDDGFLYMHMFNKERGGVCQLLRMHDLRSPLEGVVELTLSEAMEHMQLNGTSTLNPMESSCTTNEKPAAKNSDCNVLIESPAPAPDNSYAGILKGQHNTYTLTESAKFRKLCDAIDTPLKLYDERQFPPVAIAAKE